MFQTNMSQASKPLQGIEVSVRDLVRARMQPGLLDLTPSRPVKTQLWGANRSVFLGQGMEYAHSRVFQQGDDVRQIDWRLTARAGRMYSKLFQSERERPVYLLVDLRAMMHFGSRRQFKSHLAAHLAAKLAWLSQESGDRVGALILTRSKVVHISAARSRDNVLKLIAALARGTLFGDDCGEELTLAAALQKVRALNQHAALVVTVSDFHDFDASAYRAFKLLSQRCECINLFISDPMDSELAQVGRISDGHHQVDLTQHSTSALAQYRRAYRERSEQLAQLCRQHKLSLICFSTADDERCVRIQLARALSGGTTCVWN